MASLVPTLAAVNCVPAGNLTGAGEDVAGGRAELDEITAGRQAAEPVCPVEIRGGGHEDAAGGRAQVDRYPRVPGFAWVLDAVAIEVVPDEIADGSPRGEAA